MRYSSVVDDSCIKLVRTVVLKISSMVLIKAFKAVVEKDRCRKGLGQGETFGASSIQSAVIIPDIDLLVVGC